METIITKKTGTTPEITYNNSNNTIDIIGRSLMLEPENFWSLNFNIIKNIKSGQKIVVNFNLEYINTLSMKCISKFIQSGKFEINWVCEDYDEDMIELVGILEKNTNQKINLLIE